jgi:hypothetical protein
MDARALADEHSGLVFFVRPKLADDAAHPGAGRRARPQFRPSAGSSTMC